MAAVRSSPLPLLNPDTRPLPPGWTQHYNAEKKLWVYLDMNVLPPRASLTHPSGPPPQAPSRPVVTHGRGGSTGFSAWSTVSTPHRNALQAHRDRQNMTVAQRLYSSALPPVEKAGFDEFGIPLNFNADELPPPAPSYGSIDPSTFTSSASLTTMTPTTSTSSSPVPPNIGRTPARRPLPKPPVPNVTTTTTSQRPAPSRPPDDPAFTQAVDQHSPMPLQPTPIKPSDNAFSRQQVGSATLADTLLQAIPQAEHPKPSGLPTHARKGELPRYKPSNNVPHRPVLPPSSSSYTLPKKSSFAGQPVITASTSSTTLNSSSAHSPSHADTQFQAPRIPSARVSMSSLANNGPTYSAVSLTQSTTSLSSGPVPLPPPLTRGTSAPPTPEPTRVRFPPNLKPPPRNTFAPPEIVAMFNRQMASSSSSAGSDKDRDAFDPMSLYSDTSHPSSLHASSPSPRSHEQRSLHAFHQTLSQSTSSRTSMSSSASPSAISSGGVGIISQSPMQLVTNNDPDLVETSKSSRDKLTKKDGKNRFKLGFGFGRMSFLPKKPSVADLDLTADPLLDSSPRISAEQVGKVIKDGFMAVMDHNTHRRGEIQLPEPAGVSSLQAQMQAMNMGSHVSLPLQPQDTSGTIRPITPQPNALSPLPFPLNQSFSRAGVALGLSPSPEPSASGSQTSPRMSAHISGETSGRASPYNRQSMSVSPSLPPRLSPMPSPNRESFHAPSTLLQAPPLPQPQPQRRFRKDPFDLPLQIPNTPAPEYQSSVTTGSYYSFNNYGPSSPYQTTGYGDLGESPLE